VVKLHRVKIKERKLRKYYGYAYIGKDKIELRSGMPDRLYLGTLIHELLHIFWPEESETRILKIGNTITHYIWHKGFNKREK